MPPEGQALRALLLAGASVPHGHASVGDPTLVTLAVTRGRTRREPPEVVRKGSAADAQCAKHHEVLPERLAVLANGCSRTASRPPPRDARAHSAAAEGRGKSLLQQVQERRHGGVVCFVTHQEGIE